MVPAQATGLTLDIERDFFFNTSLETNIPGLDASRPWP